MPVQSNVPTSFSVPDTLPTSSYDYNSYLPNDYDWTRANTHSGMDMDSEERRRIKSSSAPIPITRKLQFTDVDTPALAGLGGLDVSFDASPSEDGRIRVRIHPSSSVGQAGSPSNSDLSSRPNTGQPDIWSGTAKSNTFASPYSISSSKDDPFFGIGMPNDYGMLSPSKLINPTISSLGAAELEFGLFGTCITSHLTVSSPDTELASGAKAQSHVLVPLASCLMSAPLY